MVVAVSTVAIVAVVIVALFALMYIVPRGGRRRRWEAEGRYAEAEDTGPAP